MEYEESIRLSTILKDKGVDLIDVIRWISFASKIPLEPNYQVPFAER